jgi:5'-3' exonuclease
LGIEVPLLDCDVLTYRAGFAADSQAKKEWGKDKYLEHDYPEWALGNVKTVINDTMNKLNCSNKNAEYYLTGKGNFREEIATIKKYKGNRDPNHKPKYYKEIRDYLLTVVEATLCEGYEADDAMAMAQWAKPDRSTCIVSIDKDLNMIPGWHFNWISGELYDVGLEEANRNFYLQMLIGDTTDNIPGIKGIGKATAPKLLPARAGEASWQATVKNLYQKQYGLEYEAAMREVAMLLWMWRKPNDTPPEF